MISNIAFKLYTYAWSVAVEPFFSLSGHSLIVFKKGFTLSSKRMDRYVGCSCAHLAHSSGSATPGHGKVQVVIAYDMRNRVCQFAKSAKLHGFCGFSHSFGPKDFTK